MTKPKGKEPSQIEKFKQLAREAEADMSQDALDKLIGVAGKSKAPTKEEAYKAKRQGEAD